jgi:hypothetical protein
MEHEAVTGQGTSDRDGASFDDYLVSPGGEGDLTARVDDWPFADAGAATVELSGELRAPDMAPATPPNGPASASHAMWSDDDLLDIMPAPVQLTGNDASWSPGAAGDDERLTGANAGRSAASFSPGAHSESAARALESLASRVRSGELVLPGYVPELGDAAALAAALAALLGIRRE